MSALDERVAFVEARMDRIDDLFTLVGDLRGDMNRQFTDIRGDLNRQFADVRADAALLNQKVDRDFRWLVGLQMTVMLAVIGVLLTALFRQP